MLYTIALSMVPQVGPVTARELIRVLGSAETVLKSTERTLQKVNGVGPALASKIKASKFLIRAEEELNFIEKHKIRAISFQDNDYPVRLKRCSDSPIVIYAKGSSILENRHVIAMVGSRLATDYGKGICREFIQDLIPYNPIIVSGLAYGIDITSHKEALRAGLETLAVVGHGLDRMYPSSHRGIALDIIKQGALITEFCSGVKPDRENFPARNRIIAGLSDAVIVVEAREQGGALITAEIANSYNRDVFAFPGRTYDPQSKGCLNLIRNNTAQIISSADEFIQNIGWGESKSASLQRKMFIDLNEDENKLIQYLILENKNVHFDQLMQHLEWKHSKLATVILQLEINGLLKSLPGSMYRLC